jgi:hypothetical protein
MKTFKTQRLLLGFGVLGVGTLLGSFETAQAAPQHRPTAPISQVQFRPHGGDRRAPHNSPDRDNAARYHDRRNGFIPNKFTPNRVGQVFQSVTGVVTNDLDGNDFILRTAGGNLRVMMQSGEPGSLNQGDRVQVSGYYQNGTFQAQNLSFLRNR